MSTEQKTAEKATEKPIVQNTPAKPAAKTAENEPAAEQKAAAKTAQQKAPAAAKAAEKTAEKTTEKPAVQNTPAKPAAQPAGVCRLSGLIAPGFTGAYQAVRQEKITELILAGGRGSTKSSFAAITLVLQLLRHPSCHAAALRRVGATLRASVFEQVIWAIGQLGLADAFETTVSPMRITLKATGQRILFFGLDDAGKLKSIKLPFGHLGLVWFEELDQFDGPGQLRSALQSLVRGGDYSLVLESFNPPQSPKSWVNVYAAQPAPGRLVHRSDYRTVPPAWLGARFLADAAALAEKDPLAYRHEYLGQATGGGAAVFLNVSLKPLTQKQINSFERRYHGVDWGWYPDPWAFNSCGYDGARRILYIYDEATRRRTPNRETAALLLQRGVGQSPESETLYADSAEPKSCSEYRAMGLACRGAKKGPGSLCQSMKWLQSLAAIVIDPARCPDTAREFSTYEYRRCPDTGEALPGYPDRDNHHIDAVRYAVSALARRE